MRHLYILLLNVMWLVSGWIGDAVGAVWVSVAVSIIFLLDGKSYMWE